MSRTPDHFNERAGKRLDDQMGACTCITRTDRLLNAFGTKMHAPFLTFANHWALHCGGGRRWVRPEAGKT